MTVETEASFVGIGAAAAAMPSVFSNCWPTGPLGHLTPDPPAEDPGQRRKQGERGGHRDQDGQGDGEGDALERAEPERDEAHQRDDHRAAGEEHRAARRVERGPGGLLGLTRPRSAPSR